jgi:penicillin-binding protein 1C
MKKFLVILILGSLTYLLTPVPRDWIEGYGFTSMRILDREGVLLREVLSSREGIAHWVPLSEVSPHLLKATIYSEDKRFYRHFGVDPFAIVRSLVQNIRSQRIISGGSTITQQLVRSLHNWKRRNLFYKLMEIFEAIRLEIHLSKKEILEAYLNRISYGNQTYGIHAASFLYFRKPPSHLSLAESAFLASIPRAPTWLNPYRNKERVLRRKNEILHLLLTRGRITEEEFRFAKNEPIRLVKKKMNFRAPHFTNWILQRIRMLEFGNASVVQTTLDYNLQKKIERMASDELAILKKHNVTNIALIVMDTPNGEILSMIGSRDFFDEKIDGQVNGAISLRQPGSTLKPFTYGIALEERLMSASTLLPDIETHIGEGAGDFYPRNYDRKYHGPVRLRTALACSYNIPAVRVLEEVGPESLLMKLREAGFRSLARSSSYYGLGLTLGDGEVSLRELVNGYRAIANLGMWESEKTIEWIEDKDGIIHRPTERKRKRILTPQVSYLLTHILSDENAKLPAFSEWNPLRFPFQCASKTGTSKDYRDSWVVGYTRSNVLGVWVGNFDGSSMEGVSGVVGAGPLFRNVMLNLAENEVPRPFPEPEGLIHHRICTKSGDLLGPYCPNSIEEIYLERTSPSNTCQVHRVYRDDSRESASQVSGVSRVYEIYTPEYYPWMEENAITVPSNLLINQNTERDRSLTVTFPDDGDIFKIDPILRMEYQKIPLRASVPMIVEEISWIIDGSIIAEVGYPYTTEWKLEPGNHTIQIHGGGTISNPVEILVLK